MKTIPGFNLTPYTTVHDGGPLVEGVRARFRDAIRTACFKVDNAVIDPMAGPSNEYGSGFEVTAEQLSENSVLIDEYIKAACHAPSGLARMAREEGVETFAWVELPEVLVEQHPEAFVYRFTASWRSTIPASAFDKITKGKA